METNPRSPALQSETAWAPPPPVVMPGQPRSAPPPLPASMRRASAEADFDATLGSLVDHFASLPPAEYGEAPELPELAVAEPSPRGEYLRWGVGSLVLGAALAGGVIAGFHFIRHRPAVRPAATRPDVPIVVKVAAPTPAAAPAVEPLAEESTPQATALPDEPTAKPAAVPAAPAPRKKIVHRATRRSPAVAPATRSRPARSSGGSDDSGGWDDPYK